MFFQKKNRQAEAFERGFYSLGTLCSIKIFPNLRAQEHYGNLLEVDMEKILDEAEALVYSFDDQFSVFKEESEISAINKNSGVQPINVKGDTYFLIKKAMEYCDLSDGRMDITVGPLSKVWRKSQKEERLTKQDELTAVKELVNFKRIKLEESKTAVLLETKGMELDLGCVAKGYCADLIRDFLKEKNIERAVINLGGNIVVMGEQATNKGWRIGIQHPEQPRGSFIGYVDIQDSSMVTSGDYERYFEKNGKRYHHILDPRTASPLDNEIVSVTVISKSSLDGDGFTTGVFMLGVSQGMELINKLNGIEAIIITKDREIFLSDGIQKAFQLEDKSYLTAIPID